MACNSCLLQLSLTVDTVNLKNTHYLFIIDIITKRIKTLQQTNKMVVGQTECLQLFGWVTISDHSSSQSFDSC